MKDSFPKFTKFTKRQSKHGWVHQLVVSATRKVFPLLLSFAALPTVACAVQFALKIDRKRDVRTVKRELEHLHRLKYCSQVCNVHGSGTENGRFFIVMDLLGANLAETMRRDFGGHMPVETIKLVGASLLNAVEQLHTAGYVHRDVKPANFALHSPAASVSNGTWVTIDFGLARRYVDENGIVMPERQDASFRGSTTYASVFAHDDKDLGRRDDLWSWFYILVEMLEGTFFGQFISFIARINQEMTYKFSILLSLDRNSAVEN